MNALTLILDPPLPLMSCRYTNLGIKFTMQLGGGGGDPRVQGIPFGLHLALKSYNDDISNLNGTPSLVTELSKLLLPLTLSGLAENLL